MNKKTKILFVIYLIVAPTVYFISSAHTPSKQQKVKQQFVSQLPNNAKDQYTAIAFINDDARQYQHVLTKIFKGKKIKTVFFVAEHQQKVATHASLKSQQGMYANNRFFKKAGIKIDNETPSMQLFIVDKQHKLVLHKKYNNPYTIQPKQLFSYLKTL
ncbi:hypothetical protein [Microscilla marina]|uniref:Uncharacterized protein n=1 Tax=Microscilla marina ATCC 23134 TaxID=313606 RepID=A1ZLQ8_MICM2|nr:hypothetical protein [Microscilla marina]EAY28812.1 hypothetical protein M23134_07910 [Microscilla marina ATCC 23134]